MDGDELLLRTLGSLSKTVFRSWVFSDVTTASVQEGGGS